MLTRKNLEDYFKGKQVLLVGNSVKLCQSNSNGDFIDSFPIVCRINKGVASLGTPWYGKKCDVFFYASLVSIPKKMKKAVHDINNPIWIKTSKHNSFMAHDKNYNIPHNEWWHLKTEKLKLTEKKIEPTTGIVAVDFILSCSPKKLTLIGFDWKKSPTFYDLNRTHEPHDYSKEESYIRSFEKVHVV